MLAQVLLASLVLLVPCLIVADVTMRQSNTVHEQAAETAAGSGNTVDERTGVNDTVALLRKIFRLGPENLGVRPSLFLLVGIPTVVAVALGGLRIASAGIVDAVVVLVVLVLALVSTVIIGSSLLRRLRNLRAGALQVADVRLPEAVHRISETVARTYRWTWNPSMWIPRTRLATSRVPLTRCTGRHCGWLPTRPGSAGTSMRCS